MFWCEQSKLLQMHLQFYHNLLSSLNLTEFIVLYSFLHVFFHHVLLIWILCPVTVPHLPTGLFLLLHEFLLRQNMIPCAGRRSTVLPTRSSPTQFMLRSLCSRALMKTVFCSEGSGLHRCHSCQSWHEPPVPC